MVAAFNLYFDTDIPNRITRNVKKNWNINSKNSTKVM